MYILLSAVFCIEVREEQHAVQKTIFASIDQITYSCVQML